MKNKRKQTVAFLLVLVILIAGIPAGRAQAAKAQALKTAAQSDLEDTVETIVNKETKRKDSAKEKLKKLFLYMEEDYDYGRAVSFETYSGWEEEYAAEMFEDEKGSCYHFAAAYAYLAKKATDYPVRIGVGKTNGFSGKWQKHAWVEIKIKSKWYVCDPNMDKYAEESSLTYFLKKRSSLKETYNNYKKVEYVTVSF